MPRLLALLFLPLLFAHPLEAAELLSRTQVMMGDVSVTLTVDAKASRRTAAFQAMEEAFREARRLEDILSEWRPGSQTSLLNQNAGKALVPIGRELLTLLEKAREISEITDGAFDITFASQKSGVSYRNVVVLPELGLAYLPRGVKIGVSAIAKGAIVDAMGRILRGAGFRRFLVNAGDLYASGRWKIGIRDPNHPDGERTVCEVTVRDRAVSTSGQYERGPHIIDPRARKPVSTLASVTVIAGTSTEADALATGFFVLGAQGTKEVLAARSDLSAVLVGNDESHERSSTVCMFF